MKDNESILAWITRRRSLSKLKVDEIPLCDIKNWIATDEKITHKTKKFFSIIGIQVSEEQNNKGWPAYS